MFYDYLASISTKFLNKVIDSSMASSSSSEVSSFGTFSMLMFFILAYFFLAFSIFSLFFSLAASFSAFSFSNSSLVFSPINYSVSHPSYRFGLEWLNARLVVHIFIFVYISNGYTDSIYFNLSWMCVSSLYVFLVFNHIFVWRRNIW